MADPAIANRPPWVEIVTCVGAVGGGTYDYLGYIGLFREKGWGAIGLNHGKYRSIRSGPSMPISIDTGEENIRRGRRWLLPSQVDIIVCFLSVFIFSMCFVILGAKILHPERLVPAGSNLFNYQANFLTRLHPCAAVPLSARHFLRLLRYDLRRVRSLFSHGLRVPDAGQRLVPPVARSNVFVAASFSTAPTLGLIFLWTLEKPIDIVTPAALIGGVFTCGLWCLAMIWADGRFLPRQLQMPWLLWTLVAISGVVLTLLGAKGIWDYVAGLMAR